MGKKDSSTKVLMKRREIFADAFGLLFQRAGITVDMDSLEERDTVVTLPVNIGDAAEWVDRANDVAFEAFVRHVGDTDFVLLCVENQSEVAYDMPLRNLITSGLQWWKYRTQLAKKNQETKNLAKGGEFLSKIRKDDRLPPVVIMVLYLGLKPWTGPERFQDMVSPTIPGLRQFMSDSPTNVVSLVDLTAKEQTYLKSPLRILSKLLQTHGDKKAMRTTWLNASLSGMKAGSIDIPEPPWPTMAATKQIVIPAVKMSTITTMLLAVAFLLFAHSSAIRPITASVTRTSPR